MRKMFVVTSTIGHPTLIVAAHVAAVRENGNGTSTIQMVTGLEVVTKEDRITVQGWLLDALED